MSALPLSELNPRDKPWDDAREDGVPVDAQMFEDPTQNRCRCRVPHLHRITSCCNACGMTGVAFETVVHPGEGRDLERLKSGVTAIRMP